MKKIQVVFAAAAVMLAVAGVYASSIVTTVYYVPFWENRNETTAQCDVTFTSPCSDTGSLQCIKTAALQDQLGNPKGNFSVLIGKRIDGGACLQVVKQINE